MYENMWGSDKDLEEWDISEEGLEEVRLEFLESVLGAVKRNGMK